MKSRAAVCEAPDQSLQVRDLELAELPAHCLLIRTVASGVCGTDIHVVQGTMEPRHGFPAVLGHEAAGVVEQTGSAVQGFAQGDRVAISAITPCLSCGPCLSGQPHLCDRAWEICLTHPFAGTNGEPVHAFFGIGSLSELVIVPASAAVKVPDDIPWPVAALMACGGQTGLGSVWNVAKVSSGSTVAVFGCGTVGLCVIMASRLCGASSIIGIDVIGDRLRLAREMGATDVVDAREVDPADKIASMVDEGSDFAFECVGKTEVMEQAFRAIRPGGMVVVIGAAPQGAKVSIDADDLLEDRTIVGSLAGSVVPRRDYPRWFALYREGRLPLHRLISTMYTLDSVNEAFDDMASGRVTKPVVMFRSGVAS